MKHLARIFLWALLPALLSVSLWANERSFKVTLHIVDDEAKPISEAQAGVAYEQIYARKESERVGSARGTSNAEGNLTLEGKTGEASIGYYAEKAGYYPSRGLRYNFTGTRLSRWEPWNPAIEVLLKRMRNPVPMYAKRVAGEVPVKGEDVGYDMAMGDWVAPHGKGRVADIVFHGTGEVLGDRNYRGELTVFLPGQGNGLIPFEVPQPQPSPLRMPYAAPDDGYEPKRVWRAIRKYNPVTMRNEEYINDSSKTQNFYIRVRTKLDAEGKVLQALYGKIHAPFEFGPRGKGGLPAISFIYYLNPDGTRNIEYDPSRNLLNPHNNDDSSYRSLAP